MATAKQQIEELRAEIVALQSRVAELESSTTMRVRPQVAPRPIGEQLSTVARAAAISALSQRFPDRRSFTSIEVMDEMSSHA